MGENEKNYLTPADVQNHKIQNGCHLEHSDPGGKPETVFGLSASGYWPDEDQQRKTVRALRFRIPFRLHLNATLYTQLIPYSFAFTS